MAKKITEPVFLSEIFAPNRGGITETAFLYRLFAPNRGSIAEVRVVPSIAKRLNRIFINKAIRARWIKC